MVTPKGATMAWRRNQSVSYHLWPNADPSTFLVCTKYSDTAVHEQDHPNTNREGYHTRFMSDDIL